ncbi:MAG: hypothetical protein ACFB15_25845 [Cyclobacteriaceae bacterium]
MNMKKRIARIISNTLFNMKQIGVSSKEYQSYCDDAADKISEFLINKLQAIQNEAQQQWPDKDFDETLNEEIEKLIKELKR